MSPFVRDVAGIHVRLTADERAVVRQLAAQLGELLKGDPLRDPATARLLPSAYPDDPEADAEFREYTASDLADEKRANASRVAAIAAGRGRLDVLLDQADEQAWLHWLTDVRLVVAARVAEERSTARADALRAVGDWLGYAQEALVELLMEA